MLIALGAGVLGVILSTWLLHLESQVRMPFPMPVAYDLQPDGRVLVLASLLTLVTGLAFGLAPALQVTRSDLTPSLKEGATVFLGSRRGFSLRNLLMVSQFAGSLTLLVIVGVMSIGIQSTLGIQSKDSMPAIYTSRASTRCVTGFRLNKHRPFSNGCSMT